MATYCEVCSLQLNNDYAFRTHLTGKKHLKNYQQKEFQKKILENSIFVSPIPRYFTACKLIEFFLQFGSIDSYKIGANYAIITFNKRYGKVSAIVYINYLVKYSEYVTFFSFLLLENP